MVKIKDLSFKYDDVKPILEKISLSIDSRENLAIIGPNGAGKTTLSYCITGIIPHLIKGEIEGDVLIDGKMTTEMKFDEIIKKIGIVFEDPENQFVTLRVKDEIAFSLKNLNLTSAELETRLKEIVDFLSINDICEFSPQDLSMGQKQKVAIASVIALDPKLLILDQPESYLDPVGQDYLISMIKKMKFKGITVVLFSHNLKLVKECTERIIGIKQGKISFDKPITEVNNRDYALLYGIKEKPFSKTIISNIINDKYKEQQYSIKRNTTLIRIEKISFKYPKNDGWILDGLNLEIIENEIIGIVGKNGCGKSTLLLLIAGILRPNQGRITFCEQVIHRMDFKDLASKVCLLFQNPYHQIFAETIYDELAFGLKNLGLENVEIDERIHWVQDYFELGDLKKDPQTLSFGWKKLLCLAAAIAMKTEIILLDEPELGLDPYFQKILEDILMKLYSEGGKTIVIATHDLDLIEKFAHRIALVDNRIISQLDTPQQVIPRINEYYEQQKRIL